MADDKPRKKGRNDSNDRRDENDQPRYRRYDDDDFDDYNEKAGGGRWLPRETLRTIAVRQRGAVFCIGVYIGLLVLRVVIKNPDSRFALAVLAIPVLLVAAIYGLLLATKVYTTLAGIVLGVLAFVPVLGLIVLIVINQKATGILRRHDIRVGLFGADSSDI